MSEMKKEARYAEDNTCCSGCLFICNSKEREEKEKDGLR